MKRFENSLQTAGLLAVCILVALNLSSNSVAAAGVRPVMFVSFRRYLVTNITKSNANSRNRRNVCTVIKQPFSTETFDYRLNALAISVLQERLVMSLAGAH